MGVKSQLCNIVITLKRDNKLTYDQIVDMGNGAFHRSQLVSILKHQGESVSVNVIEDVVKCLGGNLSIICSTDPTFENFTD
jgi:hypothetical protein